MYISDIFSFVLDFYSVPLFYAAHLRLHGCIVCRFVRRWFRGRTTCARCDVEFLPHPHSSLAEKRGRNSTVLKTPSKHNPAGQAAGPRDIRKPELRPEEKVFSARSSINLPVGFIFDVYSLCYNCTIFFIL